MIDQQHEPDEDRNLHNFSLAEMIVGMTAFAALFGIWQTSTTSDEIDIGVMVAATIFGALAGIVVGVVAGLARGRWHVMLGAMFGAAAGGVGGAGTSVTVSWSAVFLACTILCGTAAVCGQLVRRGSKR